MNFFVTDGLHLAYRIDGPENRPALVLINSLGTDQRMWNPQIVALSQNLRVIRYDCRGHGASDVPTRPYTIQNLGLDLLTLLDTLKITQAHICGLSLGGLIAQWVALHYPDRVMHAIFANTAARIGTEEIWNTRIDAVKTGGMAAIQDAVLARFLSADFRQRDPETTQQIGEMIAATNSTGYIEACTVLRDTDLRGEVNEILTPSLIIAGELDESTPPTQAYELHTAIAESKFVTFRNVAHLSNIEQPDEFSKHILNFLSTSA